MLPQRCLCSPVTASGTLRGHSLSEQDYTFGYWLNGMRKHKEDRLPNVLCLESGYAGFSLDLGDFTQARYGIYDQALNYSEGLATGAQRVQSLPDAELVIELESRGRVFRAVSAASAGAKGYASLRSTGCGSPGK